MTLQEFQNDIRAGIPDRLPAAKPYDKQINHAPKRKEILTPEEQVLAIKNALRYFPAKHHALLAKEFAEELRKYGRIYMYRLRPDYEMYARPIDQYPCKCRQAAAIMLMIQNNLDKAVAQHPHELITYGGNGAVFQNWAQYRLTMKYLSEMTDCQTLGQGFIGGAPDGTPTTLGREGSDYSAAVVANILDAESMAVWKDVDGVLNADPKIFPDAVQIAELNYLDTIELAYSGAQIIHPKTIKPLQNKNIPLYVRPFGDKRKPGTVIRGMSAPVEVPILILKKDQVLLTIRSRDFSFVLEEKFATIFSLLERFRIKTNLIHNSAVNLSLCVDNSWHIDEAIEALREAGCDVMKAENMELLTVRGYTDELWRKYARGPQVFVRQATQSTVRVVRKK